MGGLVGCGHGGGKYAVEIGKHVRRIHAGGGPVDMRIDANWRTVRSHGGQLSNLVFLVTDVS